MWRVEFFVKLRINKRRAKHVGDDDKRGLENKYAVGILHTGTGSGMQWRWPQRHSQQQYAKSGKY